MAYFEGTFWSDVLEMDTDICAVIPDDCLRTGRRAKVLYLLHGYGGNCRAWMRSSNIEQIAGRYGLAVIMPEVGYSYYQDMVFGKKYFTYLVDELPKFAANLFPISEKAEDQYISGSSMGGFGALKCILARPGQYAAGAGLCAVPDIHWALDPVLFNYDPVKGKYDGYEQRLAEASGIYGVPPKIMPDQDLYALAKETEKSGYRPKIISVCGKQDKLFPENERLASYLEKLDLDFTFRAIDGYHDADFSQRGLELALELIFGGDKDPKKS